MECAAFICEFINFSDSLFKIQRMCYNKYILAGEVLSRKFPIDKI